MLKVLIINKSEKHTLKIAKKIADLYTDISIITISDIEKAIAIIKAENPNVIVVNLDMKDSKGRDLLERLVRWDFEILIYKDDELYCIQDGNVAKKGGYVLKKIEIE